MFGNYLLLCLFGILAYFVPDTVAREAIIRGTLVQSVDQFPYHVSVMFDDENYHVCGGAIISDNFIVTVASCVVDVHGHFDITSFSIAGSRTNMNLTGPPAVLIQVERIFVPMSFRSPLFTPSDIAILELRHPLGLTTHNRHLKALKLPQVSDATSYAGKKAMIAGFGWNWINNENGDGGTDGHLRFAEALILEIHDPHYHNYTNAAKQICAQVQQHPSKSAKSRGVCHGDAGGALVYNDTLIGVLSIGQSIPTVCSEKKFGSIYTRASYYLKFIEDSMNYDPRKHHGHVRVHNVVHH